MEPRVLESKALGDYTIIKQIGQGSLGNVFLAEHRYMKKQFIIKVLPEELSSDRAFMQRFEDEVSLLAALDHPRLVKIHNISFQQGQHFLVTDCVVDELGETTNLAQYLISRGIRLDEETLYRILYQVAEALDYAHSKRSGGKPLVHRNLKLNNILIAKNKNGIDVMVSDFGLSKIVGIGAVLTRTYKMVADALNLSFPKNGDRYPAPSHDPQKLIPLHASFLQNYAFLAPEQKRLDSPYPIDSRTDVYAFGVLAYYLLMGEFPDGLFDMPSLTHTDYKLHWDYLIRSCLQLDPRKRTEQLTTLMESIRTLPKLQAEQSVQPSMPGIAAVAPTPQSYFVPPQTVPQQAVPQPEPAGVVHARGGNSVSEVERASSSPPLREEVVQPHFTPSRSTPIHAHSLPPVEHSSKPAHAPAHTPPPQPTLEQTTGYETVPEPIEARGAATLKPFLQSTQLDLPETDPDPASIFNIDTSVKHYVPERREVRHIQPLMTEMVVVEGGSFWRGSNDGNRDESPRHQITLSSFAIDIHPVTNEQFVRFLDVMGGEKDSNHQDIIRLRDSRIKRSSGKLSIESGYAKHPVVGVTWYGAVAYAKWLGKRLPTEVEWEIASRGGLENAYFPTGDDIEKSQANFFSSDTTPVMSYAANGYGLYDMAGNVYEWCHDWYGYNYYEASLQEPENPRGPLQGVYRVLRGGCWKSLKEDLRCSRRHRNNPGTVNGTYGFRCAADVQSE